LKLLHRERIAVVFTCIT